MNLDRIRESIPLDAGILDTPIFSIGNTQVTGATLAVAVVVFLVTWTLSWLLQRALEKALSLRGVARDGSIRAFKRLLHYAVLLIGIAIGLDTIGINLSALFAAGAVFAVGLGFAMQNIAQNFVSGVILLLERTIKPGDVLQVEGRTVRVERMGIRATICRTLDEEEIIVPNSTLVQNTVVNYTLQDSTFRLRISVGVTYDSDMEKVKRVLEEVASRAPWRIRDRAPLVFLDEFGDSAVVWDLSVWMEDPWRARRSKGELNEFVWWAFREHGVVIASPQLDVHFDPPIRRALESVAKVS
jgi:small-conductance mechanosensitive channel